MNAVGTIGRGESQSSALDRAALAIGSALVAWSERRSALALEPVDTEQLVVRRAAEREAEALLAQRHAGADYRLYRMF